MLKQQKSQQAFFDWAARLDQFLAAEDSLMAYRQAAAALRLPIAENTMRVVALGEVNAGKSSLLNVLYAEDILSVSDAPCTTSAMELPLKNGIFFVDTPGTNAQTGQSNDSVKAHLSKADLVLVVLPAKNPFGQSVWAMLSQLYSLENKRLLFVVQHSDLLSPADLDATIFYLRTYAEKNGFGTPDFYPVSVKKWNEGQTNASGIPALIQELERLQSAAKNSSSVLHTRVQSANDLLQKIRTQIQTKEAPILQANVYQEEVKQLIARNTQQSKVSMVQFEADFQAVLADLDRQVGELSHAEARFQDLKRENRVREFLGIARQRCDSHTQGLLLEFGTQLRDGFQRTGERISKLFLNEENQSFQVSRRITLEQMDARLEQADTLIRAGVKNASVCGDILDNIASESGLKSRKLCKKARQKFMLTALLPVILLLFFTAVVPGAVQIIEAVKQQPAVSSSSEAGVPTELIKKAAQAAANTNSSQKSASSVPLWLYLILILALYLIGTIYVAAVKKSTDKWLLIQLQAVGVDAHEALRRQLPTIQSTFCLELQKTLEATEALLAGIASDFLNKNEGMSNALSMDAQLDALSAFESDLQKLYV